MGHGAALDVVLRWPKLASGTSDGCEGLIDLGAFNGANTCASSGDMSHHLRRSGVRNVCHTVPLGAELSLEAVIKLTRETILEIEFLLAFRTE